MNSNKIIRMMSLSAVSALFLTACNNSSPKMDEQPAATPETATTGMKIAYVEVDSLMSQYNFCKDYSLILQKKEQQCPQYPQSKRTTTAGCHAELPTENKQQWIYQSRASHERTGCPTTPRARLAGTAGRLGAELDSETAKYNTALHDSLQNFLKDYNKSKKYDLIISKAGDNILLADKRHDITKDVINGLNKRYKPATKKEETKK